MVTFLERSSWLPCLMALTRASSRARRMPKMSFSVASWARSRRSISSCTRRASAGSLGITTSTVEAAPGSRGGVMTVVGTKGTGWGLLSGRGPSLAPADWPGRTSAGPGRASPSEWINRRRGQPRRVRSQGWEGIETPPMPDRNRLPRIPTPLPSLAGTDVRGPGPGGNPRRAGRLQFRARSERLERRLLFLLDVEELVQARDLEDLVNLRVDVAQDQPAADRL